MVIRNVINVKSGTQLCQGRNQVPLTFGSIGAAGCRRTRRGLRRHRPADSSNDFRTLPSRPVLSCPTRIPAHCSAGNCAQLRLCSTLSHSFTFFSPSAQTVHSDTPRDTAAHSSGTASLEPPTDLRLGVALSLLFTLELSTFRPHTLDTTRTFALPFLPLLSAADRTYQLCFTTTRSPPLTRP